MGRFFRITVRLPASSSGRVLAAELHREALLPHVLLVEHDADTRKMLVLLLRSHGYRVDTAADGEEALKFLQDHRPCLVLLNLDLPVMDGWEFREHQLHDPAVADVPVVCMTEMLFPEEVGRRLGMPCVGKPYNFPAIMRHVEQICGPAPRRPE